MSLETRVRRALCRHPTSHVILAPSPEEVCALCGESWRRVERRRSPSLVDAGLAELAIRATRAGMTLWSYAVHSGRAGDRELAEWYRLTTSRRLQLDALRLASHARGRAFVVLA